MEELKLMKRVKNTCHSAKGVRSTGKVPGVIYGAEIGNALFDVDKIELEKELSIVGEHAVIGFNLDGKSGKALIKEVQKSPVGHKVIHIDLEEISDSYNMHTEVAIKIEGKGLLESKALVLQSQREFVKVVCKAKDLPKEFVLDVSKAESGTVFHVKDLVVPEGVKIDENLSDVIVSVNQEEKEIEDEEGKVEE